MGYISSHGPIRNIRDTIVKTIFSAIAPGRVTRKYSGGRIERRSRHGSNIVTSLGQPFRHFPRILANANQFGSEIEAMDEDTHRSVLSMSQLPEWDGCPLRGNRSPYTSAASLRAN